MTVADASDPLLLGQRVVAILEAPLWIVGTPS